MALAFWDNEKRELRTNPTAVRVGQKFQAVYDIPAGSALTFIPDKGAVMGGWTSGATVTGVCVAGVTTLTANTANTFYEDMVGWHINIADTGHFEVTSITSGTIAVLSGDATCTGKALQMLLVPRVLNWEWGQKVDEGTQRVIITFLQPLPYS